MTSRPFTGSRLWKGYQRVSLLPRFGIVVCAFLLGLGSSTAFGAMSDFVIDSSQSYITLSGHTVYFGVYPLEEQFPGGLTAALSGDIFADLSDLSAITIMPSLAINIGTQATLAQPGGLVAQFAGQVQYGQGPANLLKLAAQDLVFGPQVGPGHPANIAHAVNGVLDTSKVIFVAENGITTADIVGTGTISGNGFAGNNGVLQIVGSGAHMVIPFTLAGDAAGGLIIRLTGQIVADTAGPIVPEPSTLALAGLGAMALIAYGRCRPRSTRCAARI